MLTRISNEIDANKVIEYVKQNYANTHKTKKLIQEVEPFYFSQNQSLSLEMCGHHYFVLNANIVKEKENNEIALKRPSIKCNSRICANCMAILSSKWFVKIKKIIEDESNKDKKFSFLTLTFPNFTKQQLEEKDKNEQPLKLIQECFNSFKTYLKRAKLFVNYIKKLEVTPNFIEQTANFHYHFLIEKLTKKQERWVKEVWTSCFRSRFPDVKIDTKDGLLRIQADDVKSNSIVSELTAYVIKEMTLTIEKEKLISKYENKRNYAKKKDKKEFYDKQVKSLKKMEQEQITKFFILILRNLKNKRLFDLSKEWNKIANKEVAHERDWEINFEMLNHYLKRDTPSGSIGMKNIQKVKTPQELIEFYDDASPSIQRWLETFEFSNVPEIRKQQDNQEELRVIDFTIKE